MKCALCKVEIVLCHENKPVDPPEREFSNVILNFLTKCKGQCGEFRIRTLMRYKNFEFQ